MRRNVVDSAFGRKDAVIIKELTPELRDDFLNFFDHDAFADNPAWFGCYCMYFHFRGTQKEWNKRSTSENREAISTLINHGEAHGLLAYVNGRPAGWCHAAPRTAIPKLKLYREFAVEDPERVGSIVCFVIAKPYRCRGIARRLLDAACDTFTRQGLALAEAYPRKHSESDSGNFPGPLKMYLDAGFTVFRELERYVMVRKRL